MQVPVVTDKMSELLMAHEGALELYRVVVARTTDPELVEGYERLRRETGAHRAAVVRTIETMGGDPSYVSPLARLAQVKFQQLRESSLVPDGLSPQEIELNDLENVLVAETKHHADWELLRALAEQVDEGGDGTGLPAMAGEAIQQVAGALTGKAGPSGAGDGSGGPINPVAARQGVRELASRMAGAPERLAWARQMLRQRCLRMVTQGPAPDPARWQLSMTGPVPPIDQIHPAVATEGLLLPSQQPMWRASPAVEQVQAGQEG